MCSASLKKLLKMMKQPFLKWGERGRENPWAKEILTNCHVFPRFGGHEISLGMKNYQLENLNGDGREIRVHQ